MSIPDFAMTVEALADKSTLILGGTGTGKSIIVNEVLYTLREHIEQVIVISGTDNSNGAYGDKVVPEQCVYTAFTPELLENLYERQSAFADVYKRANDAKLLKRLFERAESADGRRMVASIEQRLSQYEAEVTDTTPDPQAASAKIEHLRKDCNELIISIYKHYIRKHRDIIMRYKMAPEEQHALKYIDFNPRLLLIFDDVTEQIDRYKKHQIMQKIFFQNRHAYITVVIAAHSDSALGPALKKSAANTIFTDSLAARGYFNRDTNSIKTDKVLMGLVNTAISQVRPSKENFTKLVWQGSEGKFHKHKAEPHSNFRFGGDALWRYCSLIAADKSTRLSTNKFMSDFC